MQGLQVTVAKRPPQMLTEKRMARRTVVTSQDWTWIAWKLVWSPYRNECLFCHISLYNTRWPRNSERSGEVMEFELACSVISMCGANSCWKVAGSREEMTDFSQAWIRAVVVWMWCVPPRIRFAGLFPRWWWFWEMNGSRIIGQGPWSNQWTKPLMESHLDDIAGRL